MNSRKTYAEKVWESILIKALASESLRRTTYRYVKSLGSTIIGAMWLVTKDFSGHKARAIDFVYRFNVFPASSAAKL